MDETAAERVADLWGHRYPGCAPDVIQVRETWPELADALDALLIEREREDDAPASRWWWPAEPEVTRAAIENPRRARDLVGWLLSDPDDPDAPPMPGRP